METSRRSASKQQGQVEDEVWEVKDQGGSRLLPGTALPKPSEQVIQLLLTILSATLQLGQPTATLLAFNEARMLHGTPLHLTNLSTCSITHTTTTLLRDVHNTTFHDRSTKSLPGHLTHYCIRLLSFLLTSQPLFLLDNLASDLIHK